MTSCTLTLLCGNDRITIDCDINHTVANIKSLFCDRKNLIDNGSIRLLFCGTELKDGTKTLKAYNVGKHGNWNIHVTSKGCLPKVPTDKPVELPILPKSTVAVTPSTTTTTTTSSSSSNHSNVIVISDDSSTHEQPVQARTTRKRKLPAYLESSELNEETPSEEEKPNKKSKNKKKKGKSSIESEDEVEIVPPPVPVEKRAKNFRNGCQGDRVRIERAVSQRLYLLKQTDISTPESLQRKYDVLGSTGNVYEVNIGKFPTCTCPDFMRGHLCKHVIFVYARVLRVPLQSHVIVQRALLQSELKTLFDNNPITSKYGVADAQILKAYESALGVEPTSAAPEDEAEIVVPDDCDCPICFESCNSAKKEAILKCIVCRLIVHKDCIQRWIARDPSCPQCRTEWRLPTAGGRQNVEHGRVNGYLNLKV